MSKPEEPEKKEEIWCGSCDPHSGPYTWREIRQHNIHAHRNLWVPGAGPPSNKRNT